MIKCTTLLGLALFFSLASVQAQNKVAVLDLNKVFNEYYKTKDVDADLKEQMNKFRKERDDQMTNYRALVDQIKALQAGVQDPASSDATKKEKQAKFEEKVKEAQVREKEMREYESQTGRLIQETSQRQRKRIVDEITVVVVATAKTGTYDLVLDKSGLTLNGTSAFLYVSDKLPDLSDQVIKALNATQGKPDPAAAAPAVKKTP